ncbi:MAG: hypothetical protein WAU36_13295 [Cyclobacteriaceae bacterium]
MDSNFKVISTRKEEIMDAFQQSLVSLGLDQDFAINSIRLIHLSEVPTNCKIERVRTIDKHGNVVWVTRCKKQ